MEDLNRIYQSYADEVKRFLICLTSNVDLAEELTQETFYQAVKSIHRYNGECKISVWLCQIVKHSYYNYLKKEKNIDNTFIAQAVKEGIINASHLNDLQNGSMTTDRLIGLYITIQQRRNK